MGDFSVWADGRWWSPFSGTRGCRRVGKEKSLVRCVRFTGLLSGNRAYSGFFFFSLRKEGLGLYCSRMKHRHSSLACISLSAPLSRLVKASSSSFILEGSTFC